MVIQTNMSPKSIVQTWEITATIFQKYSVPLVEQSLETILMNPALDTLVEELNEAVGSSSSTCIDGG
jgi:hypothetical protein